MSVCCVVAVAHVHWALRAQLAKPTLTTAKTTTVRTEQPASTESTTTLVFVPPTTQVSAHSSLTQAATALQKSPHKQGRCFETNSNLLVELYPTDLFPVQQTNWFQFVFVLTYVHFCFYVGEMCEEMEDVCAPGRSPCQHQSTCLITSTGPK